MLFRSFFPTGLLALVSNGSDQFRNTLSETVWQVRLDWLNSEGTARSPIVPNKVIERAQSCYDKLFNVYNTLVPNVENSNRPVIATWSDLQSFINTISNLEGRLKEYVRINWLEPVSSLLLIKPPLKTETTSAWLTRLKRYNDTTDVATVASTFLVSYLAIVGLSMTSGVGPIDAFVPIAEPGIRSIQNGFYDGLSALSKTDSVRHMFDTYMNMMIRLFNRIHPDNKIVTGNSLLVKRSANQIHPFSWFNVTPSRTLGTEGATSLARLFGVSFTTTGLSTAGFELTYTVRSRDLLVITPGLDYGVKVLFFTRVGTAVMSATASVNVVGATTATATVAVDVGPAFYTTLAAKCNILHDAYGYYLTFVIKVIGATALAGGSTLSVDWDPPCITVTTPLDREQPASSLISRVTDIYTYDQIDASTRWSDVYGTQICLNSDIDPDFSVVGYVDNYVEDDMALKATCEILEYMNNNGTMDMIIIDTDDTDYDAAYRGTDGFTKFLADLSEMGPGSMCCGGRIFYANSVALPVKLQRKVFERFMVILQTVISLYYYGNPLTVQAVSSVLDPTLS